MEAKETVLETERRHRIVNDTEYFKYIFKKTEKIACAVVYVLRGDTSIRHTDQIVLDLETASRTVLDASLASLKSTDLTVHESALDLAYELMNLESKLRVAHAARLIDQGLLDVFVHEIDSVHRALRKYVGTDVRNPLLGDTAPERREREGRTPRRSLAPVGDAPLTERAPSPSSVGRRDRVLDVIRTKGQASIKDIVEVVSDVSEKTIQRELNSLIKDNIVHREGERRWSKYSLV